MVTSVVAARSRAAARDRQRLRLTAGGLLGVAGLNLGVVLALSLARLPVDVDQPGGLALWLGRVTGLLAEVLVLGQLLLAARVPALERAVGQDTLLRWHRWLAPSTMAAVLLHPLLLAVSYSAATTGGVWGQLWTTSRSYLGATVGLVLFAAAAASSVRFVRTRMPYEGWYLVHVTTYAAVGFAWAHQLSAGSEVLHGSVVRGWWTAQLVVTVGAVVLYRALVPLTVSWRHRLRVEYVERVAQDVVSVRLSGRDLGRLGARGGQFFVWRFLTPTGWWRAHPFSLSQAAHEGGLRFTARQIGGGTEALARLRRGTRVLVEGPYGLLTDHARTRPKVLLVGAGLGIAPIRALLADLPAPVHAVVLHRASHREAAILHDELEDITRRRPRTSLHLVEGPRGRPGDADRPLGRRQLLRLVPDVRQRDVFVCGPPGVAGPLLDDLHALGVATTQIHVESFEL